MKIATWNIKRPTTATKKNVAIVECLKEINPDILILTETNKCIDLGDEYQVLHTSKPVEDFYQEGERRTSIYTKYTSTGQLETFRDDTSLCISLQTPFGDLAVYGTVIGVYGNGKGFIKDLDQQLADFKRIAKSNSLCIAGDLNISFADNYYFTNEGREKLNSSFEENNLINLTRDIPNNIDHIILTRTFVGEKTISIKQFNYPADKKLSDHFGVYITIE